MQTQYETQYDSRARLIKSQILVTTGRITVRDPIPGNLVNMYREYKLFSMCSGFRLDYNTNEFLVQFKGTLGEVRFSGKSLSDFMKIVCK